MFALTRWSPFRELGTLHREMDNLFGRVFGRSERWLPSAFGEGRYLPAIDCGLKGDKLVIRAELPGVDPKDVDIQVSGNLLTIRGEKKAEKEVKEADYYMHEIGVGGFERTLTLPEGVKTDKVKATFNRGILEITMPAEALPKARKVQVEVEHEEEPRKLKAA